MMLGAAPSSLTLRRKRGKRKSTKRKLTDSRVAAEEPMRKIQARHCRGVGETEVDGERARWG